MKNLLVRLLATVVLGLGFTIIGQAQTSYWIGSREGEELRFEVQVPADAVAVILNQKKAPNRGDDTTPRYQTFSHTIDGKTYRFHSNEIGWETPKLKTGSLTWVVEAGMGADWKTCSTKDPLWADFAEALAALGSGSDGWSHAKVVMVESSGSAAPSVKVNLDGSIGKPSAGTMAVWKLTDFNSKASLSADELEEVREYLLAVANDGRANPEFRRQHKCQKALDLPTGLKPLALDDKLNQAAQNQAEYCAKVKQATHDQDNPKLATLGDRMKAFGHHEGGFEAAGSGSLQAYPTGWMKSETHYRPWWDLDGQSVTLIGFGVAKGDDGNWYLIAVFGNPAKED
ncbi:MAG: CAP domain-containing protein [Blastocatellia bacterium]|nr:CAP domain-containing protein [Blastocatellia bacterium]